MNKRKRKKRIKTRNYYSTPKHYKLRAKRARKRKSRKSLIKSMFQKLN